MLDKSPGSWPMATFRITRAHDLAAARLGQLGHEANVLGRERLAQRRGDAVAKLVSEAQCGLVAGLEHGEADDDFPLEVIGHPDRRRLGDGSCSARIDSTSAGPSRLPATLNVSSLRP